MGRRVRQQPGVGYVDQYPGTAVARAHRGAGLDFVVHFLRFRGRAGTHFRCGGQDLIRRRDSRAELPVNLAERFGHGELRFAQVEKDCARDDTPDSIGLIPLLAGLILVGLIPLQDLQHAPEVVIADKELTFGVHVADPAIGGNDSDLDPFVVKALTMWST